MTTKYLDELNKLFSNIDKIHNNTKKVNTRIKKLSLKNIIEFSFLSSQKDVKDKNAIIKVNNFLKNETLKNGNIKGKVNKSCFKRKLNNVSVDFFKNLYIEINDTINKIICENKDLQDIAEMLTNNLVVIDDDNGNKLEPMAIDGTCENIIQKGKLTTKQDLLFYNINRGLIDDISCDYNETLCFYNNKNNKSDKNGEITKLLNYLEKNYDKFKNKILIMDRLYASYKLIEILNEHDIKYIIRMKDCLDLLKPIDQINPYSKHYNTVVKIKNNNDIKIIDYNIPSEHKIITKTNETKNIKYNSNYKLITNLGNLSSYNDEIIKKLYRARWNIETDIGKLKSNFKFETFYGCDEDFMKQKYISLLNDVIVKFIILICGNYIYNLDKSKFNNIINKRKPRDKKIDKRKKEYKNKLKEYENEHTYKARININFSQAAEGYYSKLLLDIINGNLNEKTLLEFNDDYISVERYKTGRKYERKSILPYTKWYIKMYHKKYEYEKIIDAIVNDTIDNLNKNLKSKAIDIKNNLIKIQY